MEKLLSQIRNNNAQYNKSILYYFLLIGMIFIVLRPNESIPFFIRNVLMIMALLPALFSSRHLPFFMTCLVSISMYAFSPIFPTMPVFYLAIILPFSFYGLWNTPNLKAFGIFFLFLILDIGFDDFPDHILWWLIAILLADFVKDKNDIYNLMMAFILTSFVLSLLFLMYKNYFVVNYALGRGENYERSFWVNANIFGAVISAGCVMAIGYLTQIIQAPRRRLPIAISIMTIILSVPVLVINASRGALVAFVIPSIIMLLKSKIKFSIKVAFVGTMVFFLCVMFFSSNIFDLLLVRMQEDSFASGGGRSIIWKYKLSAFLNSFDVFSYLFGIGHRECIRLVWNISTHNDFVTAFIAYGLVGLILVSLIMLYPLFKVPKKSKIVVLCLTTYMVIECFALEPVFRGYLFFLMFYIFTLKYALIEQ